MKLHKVLSINGQRVELVSEEIRLDLRTPGRAEFVIKTDQTQRGLASEQALAQQRVFFFKETNPRLHLRKHLLE